MGRNINAAKTKRESEIRAFFGEHKITPKLASRVWHFLRQNKSMGVARTKTENSVAGIVLREITVRALSEKSMKGGQELYQDWHTVDGMVVVLSGTLEYHVFDARKGYYNIE